MRGNFVIVRSYGCLPVVRRIWDEDDKGVYITNDAQLKLLMDGKNAIKPIGVPREDVFRFDAELAKNIDKLYIDGNWDWNKLEPLK